MLLEGYQIMFTAPKTAELVPFNVKMPGDNEALVRVEYNLISAGTEKAQLNGGNNVRNKFPENLGYSSVGVIEQVGKNVNGFKSGDRVFVEKAGHANYNTCHVSHITKIPDNVSSQEAVFTRVASFSLEGIRRSRLEIGESVAIVGLGMLGLFAVQFARIGGASVIIGIGNREYRQKKAIEYGADHILSPKDPELIKKVFEFTEKKTYIRGANVVIETSGTEDGLIKGLEYASWQGRVLLSGCIREMTKPIDVYKYIHLKGVNVIGAHDSTRPLVNSAAGNWTAKRDYITILGLFSDGRLDAQTMISELVSPKEVKQVYSRLLNDPQFPLGVLFDWSKL